MIDILGKNSYLNFIEYNALKITFIIYKIVLEEFLCKDLRGGILYEKKIELK